MLDRLEVKVLVDNYNYDKRLESEFGYSLVINYKKHEILFNTAYSNIFLKNARKMSVDLNSITEIVISHKHKSHSGGLAHLVRILKNNSKFIIENNYFKNNSSNYKEKEYSELIKKYLKNHKIINAPYNSFYYDDDIYFFLPFDKSEKNYSLSRFNIRNALAMVIDTPKGLYLFFGAAHSRLSMILDWIYNRFPEKNIIYAFGGINVNFDRENDMKILSSSLKRKPIQNFELSHCSSNEVFNYLKNYSEKVYYSGTGKILRFKI